MEFASILYGIISTVIISLISLVGVIIFFLNDKNIKKALLYLVSFAVGALIGDVFIHLLPEAFGNYDATKTAKYILFGIIFSFIVEKIIHWNHRHVHEKDQAHKDHPHAFAVMSLYGDAFHNFIDGILIATSYVVSIPVGIATTIAVIMHEIPQEIGDFGVLLAGGFSKSKAVMMNLLIGTTAVLGTITGFLLINTKYMLAFLLPFSAGNLLYIVLSDLVPQLHKSAHEEDSLKISIFQVIMMLLGIAAMFTLTIME